jgi:hypothetical protein
MLMSKYFNLPVGQGDVMRINRFCMVDEQNDGVAPFEAAEHAINTHDAMAEMLCNHRAFFEGIIEHAPEGTPVEQLEMYRGFVQQIDEVLGNE